MKKFALVAAVALMGTIVLPSCKKDYTCSCVTQMEGLPNPGDVVFTKTTKKDAKAACDAAAANSQGMLKCELK